MPPLDWPVPYCEPHSLFAERSRPCLVHVGTPTYPSSAAKHRDRCTRFKNSTTANRLAGLIPGREQPRTTGVCFKQWPIPTMPALAANCNAGMRPHPHRRAKGMPKEPPKRRWFRFRYPRIARLLHTGTQPLNTRRLVIRVVFLVQVQNNRLNVDGWLLRLRRTWCYCLLDVESCPGHPIFHNSCGARR